METLTIARVGTEKEIQTKFGLRKKMGVQFKEYGDIWHDVWTSGLKVGQTLQGTRASREWEGKTYWDFKLPKREDATNSVNEKLETILNKLTQINLALELIQDILIPKEQGKVPTDVDYPEEDLGEPVF